MPELLAPAGDYESFIAAVYNGADAVYLGLSLFSARAYAKNFSDQELIDAVFFAHLRNVKVYVALNIMLYSHEIKEAYKIVDFCYKHNVDGMIISDLAIASYIKTNYPKMEMHASTQMGIEDLDGIRILEKLGFSRVVLARETPYEKIREYQKQINLAFEVFIHGALCVSYSGSCLMSGLIGERSGNRGRCVGSCRKKYTLYSDDETYDECYLLSMKDLNTTEYIDEIKHFDSLKIEGRMKIPEYVANIVSTYRHLLDGNESDSSIEKTFNRLFTKGYLFNEKPENIVNIERPNNQGSYLGKVISIRGKYYLIELEDELIQGDQIRIEANEEINMAALKLCNEDLDYVNKAIKYVYIELPKFVKIGDKVYKTRYKKFLDEMKETYQEEKNKLPITIHFIGRLNEKAQLIITYEKYQINVKGNILVNAINQPTKIDTFITQLSKLNDTPYYVKDIKIDLENDLFMQIKDINELRREAISELNNQRLLKREEVVPNILINKIGFPKTKPQFAVFASTKEQMLAAKEMGIEIIYFDNFAKKNCLNLPNELPDMLVGGYNGINRYHDCITDFSLNVANEKAVNLLHNLGVKRVTLSHELNQEEIKNLVNQYVLENASYPNLELIIYGRQELMHMRYCPMKKFNLCKTCKTKKYYIKDAFSSFLLKPNDDCSVSILNGKILNLTPFLNDLSNYINVFRIQLTDETKEEALEIIKRITQDDFPFDSSLHTKGQYKRKVL